MLFLALTGRPAGTPPVIVAARNVHRAFVHAAALLDFETVWLWPEESSSLCACPVSPRQLEETLLALSAPPAAVYITSPDYLGGMADIAALSQVCHRRGTVLLVDNAHGATSTFSNPRCTPWIWGQTCAVTPRTRLCRSSPAARICMWESRHRRLLRKTGRRPWRFSAPPVLPISR